MKKCTPQLYQWLSMWEGELDGDIGHLLTQEQLHMVKIWVGNHVVKRYENILHDNNVPNVNNRATQLNKYQFAKKKWYQF